MLGALGLGLAAVLLLRLMWNADAIATWLTDVWYVDWESAVYIIQGMRNLAPAVAVLVFVLVFVLGYLLIVRPYVVRIFSTLTDGIAQLLADDGRMSELPDELDDVAVAPRRGASATGPPHVRGADGRTAQKRSGHVSRA